MSEAIGSSDQCVCRRIDGCIPSFQALHHEGEKISRCSNFEAWSKAVLGTQSRNCTRRNHPAQNLLAVLPRWAVWVVSTSDVERGFQATTSLRGGQSEDLFVSREEEILIVKAAKLSPPEVQKLIADAIICGHRHLAGPANKKNKRDATRGSSETKSLKGKLEFFGPAAK